MIVLQEERRDDKREETKMKRTFWRKRTAKARKANGESGQDRMKRLAEQAETGDLEAALELADALKWGYYGEASPERAMALYRRCTASPCGKVAAKAYYNLGVFYYYGLSDEPDTRRAFDCFMKSALIRPEREALSRLGDMYRYGQYVERNEKVAMRLYLKAAGA